MKIFLRSLLFLVCLFDFLMILDYWHYGWPTHLAGRDLGGGRTQILVTHVYPTGYDWLSIAAFIFLQVVLIFLNFRISKNRSGS